MIRHLGRAVMFAATAFIGFFALAVIVYFVLQLCRCLIFDQCFPLDLRRRDGSLVFRLFVRGVNEGSTPVMCLPLGISESKPTSILYLPDGMGDKLDPVVVEADNGQLAAVLDRRRNKIVFMYDFLDHSFWCNDWTGSDDHPLLARLRNGNPDMTLELYVCPF